MVPNKKVVSNWNGKDWPANHYSHVTFELTALADGTEIKLTHKYVPVTKYDGIAEGWHNFYWSKLGCSK